MANTNILDNFNLCDIDINIEKDGSGFCVTFTRNVHNAIKSDLKIPARQSTYVLHLPYATMDTEIYSEEKEEDEYIEWVL